MNTRERFEQLKNSASVLDTKEIDLFFDTLEPVALEEMMGKWKGGQLRTGHPIITALEGIGWYGKTFSSQLDVQPLICVDTDGFFFSDTESMNGEASIWPLEFRGKVSISLIYDGVPTVVHFRKVSADILIGIRDGKAALDENGNYFYFFLERI